MNNSVNKPTAKLQIKVETNLDELEMQLSRIEATLGRINRKLQAIHHTPPHKNRAR